MVLFNPHITQKLKPLAAVESCLSRDEPAAGRALQLDSHLLRPPGNGRLVPAKKKLEGYGAQAVQHMIDHCNGVLV